MAKGGIAEIRKKVTKVYEFISTSAHESAHSIYALIHLMKVKTVSVYEDKKVKRIHGLTYYEYPCDFDRVEELGMSDLLNTLIRAEIGMSYAGLIAERILFESISGSKQVPMFIKDGSTDDNQAAQELIEKYAMAPPGAKRSAFKRKMMREVKQELEANWSDVMLLAHALFEHHKLSSEDLFQLLTKKSVNKKFWKEHFKKIDVIFDQHIKLNEKMLKSILY